MKRVDVAVVGAGIAGITVAAEFARERTVLVLEADTGPARQTTGRSAAICMASYGGPRIQPFTRTGRAWLESGGGGYLERSLLSPRGLVVIAAPGQQASFERYAADGGRPISVVEACELFPALRPEQCEAAAYDPEIFDLDAAGAVSSARRALRERGGEMMASSPVTALDQSNGSWQVTTPTGIVEAGLVVNAAGAWSDDIAVMAALPKIGMLPMRRTICTFRAPASLGHEAWPMLLDAAEQFYLKPEPGQFLASPADETPSAPCDPRPDLIDVATALDRVNAATTLQATTIQTSWAGLRTFAPDRSLVLGPDPLADGFAWCAGHGGFGIQAAHSAARAVVTLVETGELPADVVAAGGDRAAVVPDRFRA
ncbi:MAG: FAD-binding oxidoreductase [Chloroflexota bacterium]